MVLALGVVLMELYHNKTMEIRDADMASDGQPDRHTPFKALQRWMESEQYNMRTSYREVVQYCMACFARTDFDLNKEDLLVQTFESVVRPLQQDLKCFK